MAVDVLFFWSMCFLTTPLSLLFPLLSSQKACALDHSPCTEPEDFEGNELVFIDDLVKEGNHPPMYKDYAYPERGMYAGGQGGGTKEFSFLYRLPMGVSGERVVLNWKYITANSVSRLPFCMCDDDV